ncbi:hypothetical protein AAFF_G00098030 [Aldrovandia affinis]|uniref:Uncharacterized protein n=1 Tax=Aldrovandia affinis TaxID=143900 RepID=A0AAD7VXH6_9TELE|nr:hypothetical protein AAFF_G00098030 [Aldrovandia affinis]
MLNALKFLDSIGQKSDKRLRAQSVRRTVGPVGLMKEEDSFKAQFGTVENNVRDKFQRRLPTQKHYLSQFGLHAATAPESAGEAKGKTAGVAVRTRCRPSSMLHTFSMAAGHNVRLSCLRPILPASPSELPAFAR